MISEKEIEIRYSETDQMGVVYHANYLIWFELGRAKFLKDLGFNYIDLENRNLLFPIRDIKIEYLKPCRYGERIIVETKVKSFSSIKTVYEHVVKNDKGEVKAKGESTLICVRKDNFRITKIESLAKDVYDAYVKVLKQNHQS